ncbi:MAG: type II toxin-antitoxin system Phd/YefM family antitoxin [Ruminiclostridium sp.]|nr:type II toxin-antitoxin system Phd/YefM family antitoxin [Ruminiclostridium sp.]
MIKVTATEVKNNFGKYIRLAAKEDIIITKNSKEVGRLTSMQKEYEDDGMDSVFREGSTAYSFETKKISYEKFLEIRKKSDEHERLEYIDGEIYYLASPKITHQQILYDLAVIFYNWFKGKKCTPAIAPFDIELQRSAKKRNMVQPDLMVICDLDEKTGEDGFYKGVPTLVVEVISKSSRGHDYIKKMDLYMECGVQEYWIVDPENQEIHTYLFKDKNLAKNKAYTFKDQIKSLYFEDFSLTL